MSLSAGDEVNRSQQDRQRSNITMSNIVHQEHVPAFQARSDQTPSGLRCFKVVLIHEIRSKAVDSVTDLFHMTRWVVER